jgi:hypothetical protein
MEESGKFVVEGEVTVGPYRYPTLVDAKVLGPLLIEHFQAQKIGDLHRIGNARITVELLEDSDR